jgi:adenylate kinase family enzyme
MTAHRKNYNYWKSGKGNFTTSFYIFDEFGLDNCFIELLEAKSCETKDELKQLEGGYIRNLQCVNKRIENRTKKEYYEDNREDKKEHLKQYRKDNKERMKQYSEVKVSCECGAQICQGTMKRHERTIKHQTFMNSQITKPN